MSQRMFCFHYVRNFQVILPHSFVCSLIQFYTSGSKTVPVINDKLSPDGSYPWLADRGKKRVCPTGKLIWWEILYSKYSITLVNELQK